MKHLFFMVVVFSLLLTSMSHAQVQGSTYDANGKVHFVAPLAIVTVAADTAFDTDTYLAFCPATTVEIYFGTASSVVFSVEANTVVGLKKGVVMKLKTETKCLMF